MVITKFIRGAREVEVDAVAKGGKVRQHRHVLYRSYMSFLRLSAVPVQVKYTTYVSLFPAIITQNTRGKREVQMSV